jgi:hypothetical protein
MIILQLPHDLALISSCIDRREAISEKNFPTQDSTFCSYGNLAKQLTLVAQGILKFGNFQRKTLEG